VKHRRLRLLVTPGETRGGADIGRLGIVRELHAETQLRVSTTRSPTAVADPHQARVQVLTGIRVAHREQLEREAARVGRDARDTHSGELRPSKHELERNDTGKRPGRRPKPLGLHSSWRLRRRLRQRPKEVVIAHTSDHLAVRDDLRVKVRRKRAPARRDDRQRAFMREQSLSG
jgi:hypothetical protein